MTIEDMDVIQHNKTVYNKIAKHFSDTRQEAWNTFRPFVQYVKNGDTILDLGCGNGRLYDIFTDLSICYIGVDQSEILITRSKERYPGLDVRVMEMSKLDFSDSFFDVVFCLAVFHHSPTLEHRLRTLMEISRVLKLGGRLIMTNWNLHSKWADKKLRNREMTKLGNNCFVVPWKNPEGKVLGGRYYYAFTPEDLERMLDKAGFTVERQYYDKTWWATGEKEGQNIVTIAKK